MFGLFIGDDCVGEFLISLGRMKECDNEFEVLSLSNEKVVRLLKMGEVS